MHFKFLKNSKGFTLLEILLVVGIISLLAGIVIVAINPGKQLATVRNTERKSDLKQIYSAITQYYIATGRYPATLPTTLTEVCATGNLSTTTGSGITCGSLVDLTVLVPTYITAIPVDPQGASTTAFLNKLITPLYAADGGTGYYVMKDTNQKLILNSERAELGTVIAIGTTTAMTGGVEIPDPETYIITYHGNGNDTGSVPTDDTDYEEGDTVTVLGNTGTLAQDGYTFDGWNTESDGSGTSYNPSASFTMPSADTTLYAQWTADPFTFGKPWRNQYFTNLTQQGNISTWSGSTFPIASGISAAVVTKDRVYVSGNSPASTYTAPINIDGTIGSWSSSGSVGVGVLDLIKTGNNRVYAIPTSGSIIYTNTINEDGTLNSWVNSNNNLPFTANVRMEAFTTENYVYLIRANNSTQVYYAPINEDGTLGTWANSNNNLSYAPEVNVGITVSLTNNKVYLFGYKSGDYTNLYLVANIDSNGLVGPWQTAPSIGEPTLRNHAKTFTTNNTIYYFGGQGSQAVNYATLDENGTITSWQTGTNFGATLAGSAVFATNSKLYIVGGFNVSGVSQNTIRIGNISGGKNDYTGE